MAHGRRYVERIRGARYAEVADCGHAMYFERPAGFAGRVAAFLGEQTSEPVKFSFFHLMPYPYLPDDFDEKYPSSALTFPNRFFDPKIGNHLYHRYLDESSTRTSSASTGSRSTSTTRPRTA